MAVYAELNAFDKVSSNNRDINEEIFTHCKMKSRVSYSSYRYRPRHSISFPYRPKPRKALESYMQRMSLQNKYNSQIFAKDYDSSRTRIQSAVQPKYENPIKERASEEEFLKKSSLAGFKENYRLSQVKQLRKRFSCLLPISSLFKIIAAVIIIIVIIIIGITVNI